MFPILSDTGGVKVAEALVLDWRTMIDAIERQIMLESRPFISLIGAESKST